MAESKKKKEDTRTEIFIKKSQNQKDEGKQIHYLNDTWVLWFHDMNNEKWDLDSYVQLFTFNTVEDFWILYNSLNNLYNGMYYLMRKGYPPIWDHAKNVNGGGWTFRIDKKYAHEFWEKLSCFCVGETLSKTPTNIIGVSISPKMRNVTVRLWTKQAISDPSEFDNIKKETENDSLVINFENARFTPNREAMK